MQLASGQAITPHLRLVREIGRGGMGSVWVADHLTLDTKVAVKFIAASLLGHEAALERFSREARTAAQIRSPHLVQIFDHGVMDDGTPYIVMELLTGESLGERLARTGPMALGDVVTVVEQLGRALASAHRIGVVHRDLKPENVFLVELADAADDEIFVKLLDFGVARSLQAQGADTSGVTQAGALLGTPAYMSPEQLSDSSQVGPAADLWALAVVAYRALTGEQPFSGMTPVALWSAMAARSYRVPSAMRQDLPPQLDGWFDRAFAVEPADRFASARAMSDELKRLGGFAGSGSLSPSAQRTPMAAEAGSARAASLAEQATVDFVEGAALGLALERGRGSAPRLAGESGGESSRADGSPAADLGALAATQPAVAPAERPRLTASGGSVGGAAATLAPVPAPSRRRQLLQRGVVMVAAGVLVVWALARMRSIGDGQRGAEPAASGAASSLAAATSDASSREKPGALREPALGLRALEDYRDPKGSTVANLRSASLWSAAARDLGEASEQPGAPVRWRAARLFAEGEIALNRGKVDDAVAAFRQAVEAEPGWALGHVGLASGLSEQGKLEDALRAAERAQQLDPSWWGAVAVAARAYSAAGRSDESIQEFRRALALAPENPVLLSEVALAYHAARNDQAADRYAEQALGLDPELVPAHVLRAERALERGDGKTALSEASRATAVAPKSLPGRLAEADALALLRRKEDALAAYARVLELAAETGTLGVPADRMALVAKAVADQQLPPPRVATAQADRAKPASAKGPARSRPDRAAPAKMPEFDF